MNRKNHCVSKISLINLDCIIEHIPCNLLRGYRANIKKVKFFTGEDSLQLAGAGQTSRFYGTLVSFNSTRILSL